MFEKVMNFAKLTGEQWYKKVSHLILFWVSMLFTIVLFRSFTDDPFMKEVWMCFAISIELLKAYIIREIKTKYKTEKWYVMLAFTFVYLITAFISGVCTYGTVKITLAEHEASTELKNTDTKVVQENMEVVDGVLESLVLSIEASASEKQKMSEQEGVYYTGQNTVSEEQEQNLNNVKDFLNMRTDMANSLAESPTSVQSSGNDVFIMIGSDIGMTGQQTLFWIFMVLIVILEVALFATSDGFKYSVEEGPRELSESEIVFQYIEALNNTSSSILSSDNRIHEQTGIGKADCKRYRKLLGELKHRGRPLIYTEGNGWKAHFNSFTMKKAVGDYFGEENV